MHSSAEHNGCVDDNGVPVEHGDVQARGTGIERWIVHDLTLRPAVALVSWLTSEARAKAVGFSIRAPGGGLNILNGCEGWMHSSCW